MKCTDKERQTCNVEKMGCEGCYYNEDNDRDIEILEEFIKYYESEAISRKFRGTLSISVDEYDIDAIENLIKAYKELEEKNENLKLKERNRVLGRYGEIEVHDLINKTLADDYIPVSLVEEKIEEIKNETWYIDCGVEAKQSCIEILQELLEKRK